jgi:ABC-type oligopeptide transport system ATPase subunit
MSQEKIVLTLTTIPERLSFNHPLGLIRVIYSLMNMKYDNYEIHFNIPKINKKTGVEYIIPNLLNDLKEQYKLTILFIAHDLSVVKYFCDRIAVMYFGEIVEMASSDELFKHPLHPYTRALLSAIPKPDPFIEKTRVRMSYNPVTDHDYTKEKPTLQEIRPGHFVLANSQEIKTFQAVIRQTDKD